MKHYQTIKKASGTWNGRQTLERHDSNSLADAVAHIPTDFKLKPATQIDNNEYWTIVQSENGAKVNLGFYQP